jgi:hypothetical protein
MVTIIDYSKRKNSEGEEFFLLVLQGGVEMVKSNETGRYYATARQCKIPSTFDENTCKNLIGEQMPGSIQKVKCEPYEYAIPDTGELIELDFHWTFVKEGDTIEEVIYDGDIQQPSPGVF